MGLTGDASRNLLLDPEFWRPRFERLEKEPRQLAIFPRPDLCRPGIEVLELRLRAHDGARLTALVARSSFCQQGGEVHLRACPEVAAAGIDWGGVEAGGTELIFSYPPERRLEDRVLDVLRVVSAACSLESIECRSVKLLPSDSCVQDEFAIADFLRQQGWGPQPAP
jgi:hypothetical protein